MLKKTVCVRVELSEDTAEYLQVLAHANGYRISDLLAYLGASAADGMRRPGSWEREWLSHAFFEEDWLAQMEQIPDIHYAQLRPRHHDECVQCGAPLGRDNPPLLPVCELCTPPGTDPP